MKWLIALILTIPAMAQPYILGVRYDTADATGSCTTRSPLWMNQTSGSLFGCDAGSWALLATPSGGSGTVTSIGLSRTDDTNVTATITGSPVTTSGTINIALGWTGQLAVVRGGSGAGSLTGVLLGNGTSAFTAVALPGSSTQFLNGTGAFSTPPSSGSGLSKSGYYFYDGSTYYTGPILTAVTLPTTPSWAWRNQGSATINTTGNALTLGIPASATDSIRIREISVPADPYTCTIAVLPQVLLVNYAQLGMMLNDGTKVVEFGIAVVNGQYIFFSSKYNSVTSYSADYFTSGTTPPGQPVWFQISDDSANRIFRYSYDGVNFTQLYSVGRTDFLTPTNIGFFGNQSQNLSGQTMVILHWSCS